MAGVKVAVVQMVDVAKLKAIVNREFGIFLNLQVVQWFVNRMPAIIRARFRPEFM